MGGVSHAHFNMNRIAPNNNLPATHFIEVWSNLFRTHQDDEPYQMNVLQNSLALNDNELSTIAIFKIRENKLPTLHNFNK